MVVLMQDQLVLMVDLVDQVVAVVIMVVLMDLQLNQLKLQFQV